MENVERLRGFSGTTVWSYFGQLSFQNSAISLGQGAPDWQPSSWIKSHLRDAADGLGHQYARDRGDLELVKALANSYSQKLNRPIDEMTEVMVTNGATEALYCAMMSIISDGDEVILFEPAFRNRYLRYCLQGTEPSNTHKIEQMKTCQQ